MSYSEIVYKIVHSILQVKPGQTVTISAEIHNISAPAEPLSEIPFLEEFALLLRGHNAIPVMDITTENLHKRFLAEVFDESKHLTPELFNVWLKTSDYFIDLSWRSNPIFYKSLPQKDFKKINNLSRLYMNQIEKMNKKIILLGTPTKGLANFYHLDHEILTETFLSALNLDYFELKKNCLIFKGQIHHNENWGIISEKRNLNFDLIHDPRCYYGEFNDECIMTLPAGLWQQEIKKDSLNGIIYCQQIYYEEYIWSNVQLIFEKGKIVDVETEDYQKDTNLMKSLLYNDSDTIMLNVGLNHAIKKMSLYSLFDIRKIGNISLTLSNKKGDIIILSENATIVDLVKHNTIE